MLPALVFAGVPGMGTVFSKRTAPSLRSPSLEDALVASIAAATMPIAVHNNVRFLLIARLPLFFLSSRFYRLVNIISRFGEGFKTIT
jgi:hypothetical protein